MKKQYSTPATEEHSMTFGQLMVGSYTPLGKGDNLNGDGIPIIID